MTTHQWIADRRPTAKDADKNGAVMILVNDSRGDVGVLTAPWQQVGLGTLWQKLGQGHTLVSPEPASAEAQPAGGLVEQVSKRIEFGIDANQDPEGITRAVIREVVSALRNHAKSPHIRVMTFEAAADWLELEAGRG
jgi:hypothetical protein